MTDTPFEGAPLEVGRVDENLIVELHRGPDRAAHDSASPQHVQLRINGDEVLRLEPDAVAPFGLLDLTKDREHELTRLVDEARHCAYEHGSGLV